MPFVPIMAVVEETADGAAADISSIFSSGVSLLSSAWTFISGNPILLAACAIPLVVGVIGALVALFRR